MPTYSKNDPSCISTNRIVFIGNVRLQSFTETDPRYVANPATTELLIDVIAIPGYEFVPFYCITLVLQILEPNSARFVDHKNRNNYHWDVPSGTGGWIENAVETSNLRIRVDQTNLLSSKDNGATYSVGIKGLSKREALRFTALASGNPILHASCEVTISELHVGEGLPGYLG